MPNILYLTIYTTIYIFENYYPSHLGQGDVINGPSVGGGHCTQMLPLQSWVQCGCKRELRWLPTAPNTISWLAYAKSEYMGDHNNNNLSLHLVATLENGCSIRCLPYKMAATFGCCDGSLISYKWQKFVPKCSLNLTSLLWPPVTESPSNNSITPIWN